MSVSVVQNEVIETGRGQTSVKRW